MSSYKPPAFITPVILMSPQYTTVKGVSKKTYTDSDLIWCSFKTYGGTERNINDIYVIEDTANVDTYYRPDIKSDCQIRLAESGAVYEIINEPEDIEQRHQYCKFKAKRIKGGA
nr:MAG TPA: PORTAL PROTEIN, 15 PROTEIN, HEAD PROTEIN, VIRAL INFECTION, TAILED.2A [Caudoviricetes sp.]